MTGDYNKNVTQAFSNKSQFNRSKDDAYSY